MKISGTFLADSYTDIPRPELRSGGMGSRVRGDESIRHRHGYSPTLRD